MASKKAENVSEGASPIKVGNPESNAPSGSGEDQELDDLLNDAIGDFEKPAATKVGAPSEGAVGPNTNNKWLDEFVEHVSEKFNGEIKEYLEKMGDGKDLSELLAPEEFKKILENTSQLLEGETSDNSPTPEDLKETISETLRSISEGIDNLQSSLPDELPSMFNGMNLNSDETLVPFVQNIMEMFLSKEVLHPSMDALCKTFPDWLEKNKSSLSPEDYDKYKKQYELMLVIVKKLEEENPDDSSELKRERFIQLKDLMLELQKFGHPPKDLVAESGVAPLDMSAAPQLPMDLDPSKCTLM
ncbi:peroxisomal biogenesis factor 19 [Bemisia tabaci]|uniref:peroxisomal biogenesis factor 19 n=1 Tax=Bemisia tabaci TaxID=7038 RepID=UPI0008F9B403|nr:PREDICTED: peroxisomal biogenesis factor 19 [Bemisia tabaci]